VIEKHQDFKDAYKTHNAKRAETILNNLLQRNTLAAWSNIGKYLKKQRETTQLCMIENRQNDITNALIKWRLRAKITRERRKSFVKTVKAIDHLYKRACFTGFQKYVYYQRELSKRLGNLANVLDNVKL
jgi:hypothetical protein